MQFFMHILEREMSHSNNTSFQEASQNASINVPHEKLKVTLLFTPWTKAEQWNKRQLAFKQNH